MNRQSTSPPGLTRSAALSLAGICAALCSLAAGCGDDDGAGNNNDTGIITRQQALEACLSADACGIMPFVYASLCVEASWDQQLHTSTLPIWNAIYRCVLASSGSCSAVRACFGGGSEPPSCASASDGYCDGDIRVFCDTFDHSLYTQDCSLAAQVCLVSEVATGTMAPVCAAGPCQEAPDPGECRGNLLLSCDREVRYLRDCAALGLVCGDGLSGVKACVGDGAACDSYTFVPTCDGKVVTRCVHNRLDTLDCAQLPGDKTCEPGRTECVAAGTQCEAGQESCQGSLIRVCVDGSIKQVDCQTLGYSRCELRSGGAHCRP